MADRVASLLAALHGELTVQAGYLDSTDTVTITARFKPNGRLWKLGVQRYAERELPTASCGS